MSTLPASPHPLALAAIFRTRARLYVMLTLTMAFVIGFVTRPRLGGPAPTVGTVYVSYASLLLTADTRFAMGDFLASTGQNDLDFWLSDETLFEKFLERQRVYEKAEAKLRPKHPRLAALSHSVGLMALSVDYSGHMTSRNTSAADNFQLEMSVAPRRGLANLFSQASLARESDFAQLRQDDDRWRLNQHKYSRIVIQAVAQTPQDSEVLAGMVATVLQKELAAVATHRARTQRRVIENYIRVGSKKVARAQKALQRASASEPEKMLLQQKRRQELEGSCRGLTREIADLSRQIELKRRDSAFRAAVLANPAQQALEALQQQIRLGERTYLPTSSTLMRLRDRLPNLQRLAQRMDAENAQKEIAALQASSLARQRLLQQDQVELRKCSALPSDREQQEFKLRERELATWEAELLSWEQKLLQARIEERLCQGDGTAVLLQVPRPGARSFVAGQEFLARYSKTLKMLPLAPLAALVCLLVISLFQEARQVRTRAEYFFDAPVLGELPSLHRSYQQSWQERKFKGRAG